MFLVLNGCHYLASKGDKLNSKSQTRKKQQIHSKASFHRHSQHTEEADQVRPNTQQRSTGEVPLRQPQEFPFESPGQSGDSPQVRLLSNTVTEK